MAFKNNNKSTPSSGGNLSTSYKVSEKDTLLSFLSKARGEQSRNKVKRLLSQRQVLVNGKLATKFDHALNSKDVVEVCKFRVPEQKALVGVKIIHEDEAIIVFEKPEGMSCAPTKDRQKSVYFPLSNYVKSNDPHAKVFFIEQLEAEYSGLMVAAKSEIAKKRLEAVVAKGLYLQKYAAVVSGVFEEEKGTETHWLEKGRDFQLVQANEANGQSKFCLLNYKVMSRNRDNSYVEVDKEGKMKHQMRAHLAVLGHPIIGDSKYKSGSNPIGRLAIHAKTLSFPHPMTNKKVEFFSPVPPAIKKLSK